jgi:zinc and cadmium transporter
MGAWEWALGSVLVVSTIALIGAVTIVIRPESLKKALLVLVSFSVGALFGDAFVHLVPEAFAQIDSVTLVSVYILIGILIFFALEKFVRWRHCHVAEEHAHPLATMNLVGEGIHCLFDGMLIAASYVVSVPLGIATTLAVVLHEIPHKLGDFGVLIHAGMRPKRAVLYNFATGLTGLAGAVITLVVGAQIVGFSAALIPVTAGGFIYIAGSDLVPELQEKVSLSSAVWHSLLIAAGIGFMALLLLVG